MSHPKNSRHIGRYRQIASTLARHGLGYLVGLAGLERFVPFQHGWFGHPRRQLPYTRPEHIRMALEELGATFVKIGQIVSTRPDLFPPEYINELAKLQDAATPAPWAAVETQLVAELGRPLTSVFASFEREPLAAASIGQAYAATLLDGSEVVVKVRRPGVGKQVEEDLEILQSLAANANDRWEQAAQYDPVGLAAEFARTLRAELDYVRERRNAERFARNFADDPTVHVPRIYAEQSSAQVLTLERIRGIKINDLAALDAAGVDRKALAARSTRIVLKMVFEDGFFHADPHPGNFFVEPGVDGQAGGRIGLIDFGMVGLVDERTRKQLVDLLMAITSQDADRLVDAFIGLGVTQQRVNRALLRQDLEQLLAQYYGQSLGEINVSGLITDALVVTRRHLLQMPTNMALLLKTIIMSEGLGAQLDPSFNLMTVLAPFAQQLLLKQYSPRTWGKQLGRAGLEMAQLATELPHQLRRMGSEIERGNLEIGVRPEGFAPLINRLEQLANRVVLGIIAAAFINGLAVLMSVYHPPGWDQWAGAVFAFGFVVAAGLGIYLVWTIAHSGRK